MKTAIIFDLDGTLLDTLGDLHGAVNAALAHFGYPIRTLEEVRRFVGNGAARLIALAVPENADPAPVLAWFQDYYRENCRILTAPYPGIPEALGELGKIYPLAIVSNKPDAAVKALCDDYFPGLYARGESAECPRKPAPDMVFAAMKALGAEKAVYVGDSEVDVVTAANAGVPCLSVLWGFRDRRDMEEVGGKYFCADPKDLAQAVAALMDPTSRTMSF